MSNEIKKETKIFLLPDYEKEEKYLTDMHKSGWRLKQISLYVYTFEKCEPENVIYRLDFAEQNSKDKQSYLAMFGEYGWEYIQDVNGYSYFRKNADGLAAEDTELFSDNESRLEMMKRIINTKLLPVWVIFICLVIPNFIMVMNRGFSDIPLHTVLTAVFTLLFVLYSYILIHCLLGFSKLKNKYKK